MKYTCMIGLCLIFFSCDQKNADDRNLSQTLDASLNLAVEQYKAMDQSLADTLFPKTTRPDGSLETIRSWWWTTGFFPGSLWYLYEFSGDNLIKERAIVRTEAVDKEKLNISDHDIGFKIFCSLGNGLRLTGDSAKYVPSIITAAETLVKRFDPRVGCFRSWGDINDENQYLVIIDNMMNLELLFWVFKHTGDSIYYNTAVAHADTTLAHHFRPDGSSFHVLEYNPKTGEVARKRTEQGYSDESAWARGQAWGLYGYTMTYRETGMQRYLDQSIKIADFIVDHPNLPDDKIPYWDFDAPDIPDAYRDASAGAITASALLELSEYVDEDLNAKYYDAAVHMIESLRKEPYRAQSGNNNFLLKHSVGHIPQNSEVDVPLIYADYYYIEAMMRYKKKNL